jgi:hypothetical protein
LIEFRSTDLQRVSRELDAAARNLDREIEQALERAARPVIPKMRQSAVGRLPKKGGLNRKVAGSAFSVHQVHSGSSVGLRISAESFSQIDRGKVRHPVYGHRDRWVLQRVPPNWFTEPAKAAEPAITAAVNAALERVARGIT